MGVAAVVLAGGSGSRVGADVNKVFLPLGAQPVLVRSVLTALAVPDVTRLVLVCRAPERSQVEAMVAPHLGDREVWLVDGGSERHDSEWNALHALAAEIDSGAIDIVAIHDGARPLASVDLWVATIEAARLHGGAIPLVPVTDLVELDGSPTTGALGAVQTPQSFRAGPLLAAHRAAHEAGTRTTDTAACLEEYGDGSVQIVAVPSDPGNLKITWAEDLRRAGSLLDR